ncbi:substrate-binding domain-containing protein [Paraflavisolibacter sp. H34]|uniref:hybrid sensor histidine kinase/response regulator transcription factor n=1 Tax=Huijunlia imazamoxiresistens TaxID=3127457 RepID=UPI00301A2383
MLTIRHYRFLLRVLYAFLLAGLFPACSISRPKPYIIAFSQCIESDLWRKTMLEEMKRELSFHPNISLLYRQAGGDSRRQVAQLKELLRQRPDVLIISPNEADPLTPVVEEAYKKGIPVIVVDRKISTPLYTAYVGGDNYQIGKMAGQYAANLLNGKGTIIEITGLPRSSPAIERHRGFTDALKGHPGLQVVRQLNGQWLPREARRELAAALPQHPGVSLVFAHNDMMARDAYEVFQSRGTGSKPYIIGVDGLPGPEAGMEFVAGNVLTATMLYPTGGEEAVRLALKLLHKESVPKENLLQTTVIDSSNVRLMQLQAGKIGSQQHDIERQQQMLTEQRRIYNSQRTLLYVLAFSLLLVLALGAIAFYSMNQNRRINRQLHLRNQEISDQKDQLEEMSARAQAANEAKVAFFTNISHEFRTPLTLILGPLEELLEKTKTQYAAHQSLSLIQKNVLRLLRLVNQLMDFRKIEAAKMQLRASEADLVSFAAEIVQQYKSIAHKRNIDLRLITGERQLPLWFDATMLDKVLFNLLSNAFKFTGDGGFIHMYVSKNEEGTEALVKVEDNGVGMSPEALEHAFEVFYQGDYENYKGSGLGLALSKELIQLHGGSISVSSEKRKGTTFSIRLPLGHAHLEEQERMPTPAAPTVVYEQEKIYTADLIPQPASPEPAEGPLKEKEQTVLIIEDNADLRGFVAGRLREAYEVLEAADSQSGLQQAFDNIPDLIICDVVIPGKDGMALTQIFKNDIRTSHIPVLLLTAKTSVEQQIEGMKKGADAYITKPFNVQFLLQSVHSLLANRARLKEHFTGDLSASLKTQTVSKPDRKFLNEFASLVESNLSNEDFTVEDICKALNLSRVQLYRKVKALMNINVNDYILNTRLQKAKYLLQHEATTISEIAYKVGFSSPAYFSTVFKSKFGLTPKAFKEK